jgi:hypothetical protein
MNIRDELGEITRTVARLRALLPVGCRRPNWLELERRELRDPSGPRAEADLLLRTNSVSLVEYGNDRARILTFPAHIRRRAWWWARRPSLGKHPLVRRGLHEATSDERVNP